MSVETPKNWSVRKFTDVVSLPTGQVDPVRLPYSQQPLIAPDHVEPGTGILLEVRSASEQNASSGKYVIHPGDVVYSKIRPALRKAVIAEFEGLCSADMYPFTPLGEIESRYLLALLLSERFSRFAESVSGRSGIPKVNRRELEEFSFPLPPIDEQQRIAAILNTLDGQIRVIKALLGKLDLLRDGIVRNALAEVMSDHNDSTVGALFDIKSGITLGPDRKPGASASMYLRVANVQRGRIDLSDIASLQASLSEREELQLETGDLLVVEGHANSDEIGRCALVGSHAAGLLYQNHLFRLRSRHIEPEFAELWLNSDSARIYWRRMCATSSGLYTINARALRGLPFPVVDVEVQREIIRVQRLVAQEIHTQQESLVKMREFKQGLANDLLTGCVRVRGAETENVRIG
jgi:type I restriction enzyme, S subunit